MAFPAPTCGPRAARALAAALALVASATAAAGETRISWDPDLAFEWDRANYERTIREMVQRSDGEIAAWFGSSRTRALDIRVMTKARYEQTFGSGMAWSVGAHYRGGVVHVNGGARLDGWFAGMLTHEMTHAYLDDLGTGWRLPMWLNEGIATRLGRRTRGEDALSTTERQELEVALQQKTLVPLPAGGGMTPFRYVQSLGAVLFLEQKVGKEAVLGLVRRTMRDGPFEQALDAELRWTPRDVDERFAYWVGHLQ
jgi:hypothetical protein